MYLWNYSVPLKQRLFYTDPVLATRPAVNTGSSNFGRQLMETGITADVVIPSVANACTALTAGSLTGKIAMVNTTTCAYNVKAKNVQDAGAIGMIVHRTTSNSVSDIYVANVTNVSIPSIMIPKDEGDFITSELNAGKTVNVNLKDLAVGYKNSSFDNGVMIHEYGHGVSNRLTGQGYSCLTNLEQMGEGWSDFFCANAYKYTWIYIHHWKGYWNLFNKLAHYSTRNQKLSLHDRYDSKSFYLRKY